MRASDAGHDRQAKHENWYVRCVRRTSDLVPDSWSFPDKIGVSAASLIESDIIQITGIDDNAGIYISQGVFPQYRICSNSDCSTIDINWTDLLNNITNNKYLQIRQYSSGLADVSVVANITVGGTSGTFTVTTDNSDPCAGTPNYGAVCADGSVYAGISPVTSTAMYVPRCDYGQIWNGTYCKGTKKTQDWNGGNNSGYVNTSIDNCTSWGSCVADGEANTITLSSADSDTGHVLTQVHAAAQECYDLDLHGKTDWYLPSTIEWEVIYENLIDGIPDDNNPDPIINGFSTSQWYWTSSEYDTDEGWRFLLSTKSFDRQAKHENWYVRCLRRE
jgi:hypothetical protein